jgi:peptide/nickel transport system ATP-binding protein
MAGTGDAHMRPAEQAVLRGDSVVVEFPMKRGAVVQAVSGVSIDVLPGETLGLVGESGCGKSTLAKAILQLPPPTSGTVSFRGKDLTGLSREELRRLRPQLQVIFQDPISSLNPRRRVRDIVAESVSIWGDADGDAQQRIDQVLTDVGLDPDVVGDRYPHEFSGGQAQRICVGRALVPDPEVLVCDEPVSALDVSVQAQILNLLEDMKARYGLSMLFIAHDLGVVKNISDRVAVMYLGKLCEVAPPDKMYAEPAHPYTEALIAAVPSAERIDIDAIPKGQLPSPMNPPSGCRFRTRCPRADQLCADEEPQMRRVAPDHFVACHHPNEVTGEVPVPTAAG